MLIETLSNLIRFMLILVAAETFGKLFENSILIGLAFVLFSIIIAYVETKNEQEIKKAEKELFDILDKCIAKAKEHTGNQE